MAGDTARVVRILNGLRGEGVEPVLVLWAFAREIRALHAMAFEHSRGQSLDKVLAQHRIWERRKGLVRACLKRYPSRKWSEMLQHAARIDRIIKGLQSGRVWDELLQLSTTLAGLPSRAA
jgi:DNA polymerase-3 subunit delta